MLGTSHWVSAAHAVDAEVRLYDKLLSVPDPAAEKEEKDFKEYLNPASLEILKGCKVEPGLAAARPGELFQFLRQGYFCVDSDSTPGDARLQPQRHPARFLGQDRESRRGNRSEASLAQLRSLLERSRNSLLTMADALGPGDVARGVETLGRASRLTREMSPRLAARARAKLSRSSFSRCCRKIRRGRVPCAAG